jgi:hypothetical protein
VFPHLDGTSEIVSNVSICHVQGRSAKRLIPPLEGGDSGRSAKRLIPPRVCPKFGSTSEIVRCKFRGGAKLKFTETTLKQVSTRHIGRDSLVGGGPAELPMR